MLRVPHPKSPELSIVIPAHNEAGRILPYLRQITTYCERQHRSYELLVVDDGSTDNTVQVAREMGAGKRVVAILPDLGERYLTTDVFAFDEDE